VTGDSAGWSFASAREPARFSAAVQNGFPDVEHAAGIRATLCGIPKEQVVIYRHLFSTSSTKACPHCREQAAAAPTQPCTQEQLYDKVLTAAPGQLRDDLLGALRGGARISIWINGPASQIVRHYARPDHITHGANAVQALLTSGDRIGIARVTATPSGEFVVVLSENEAPFIAFADS
jgi:hypothetical protein